MSIRRGSQRRLGRPSAVIAGATVTDSTVSVISRRQAANRLAGSRSSSISVRRKRVEVSQCKKLERTNEDESEPLKEMFDVA